MASNIRIGDRVTWLAPDDLYYEALVVDELDNNIFQVEVGGPEGWRAHVPGERLWVFEFAAT